MSRSSRALPAALEAPGPTLAPVLWPLLPAQGCWLAVGPRGSRAAGWLSASPPQGGWAEPCRASAERAHPLLLCLQFLDFPCYRAACAVTEGMTEGRQTSCSPNSERALPASCRSFGFLGR